MRKIFFTLIIVINCWISYAQINTFPTSGNVGIGTASPATNLDVSGTIRSSSFLQAGSGNIIVNWGPSITLMHNGSYGTIDAAFWGSGGQSLALQTLSGGNVGIGTTTPSSLFEVKSVAPIITINGTDNMQFKGINFATNGSVQANILSNIQTGELKIQSGTPGFGGFITYNLDGSEKMRIQATTGNVAIGTTNPQGYKLAVNGSAIATSMTVKLNSAWPDYVFKPKYQLLSLTAVKSFVDLNHRLPDMPSEAEVAKDGLNLGEIVKLQTKKIEELTLYLIEKDKQVNGLQNEIEELKKRIDKVVESINKN